MQSSDEFHGYKKVLERECLANLIREITVDR